MKREPFTVNDPDYFPVIAAGGSAVAVTEQSYGCFVVVDFNEDGEVVGIEILGWKPEATP